MGGVVTSLLAASATTVSRSRECLKKLPWVPPETLVAFLQGEINFFLTQLTGAAAGAADRCTETMQLNAGRIRAKDGVLGGA